MAVSTTAVSVAVRREVELDSITISGTGLFELPAVTDFAVDGLEVAAEEVFAALLDDSE